MKKVEADQIYLQKINAYDENGKLKGQLVYPHLDSKDPKEIGKKLIIIDKNNRNSEPKVVGEFHGFKLEVTTITNFVEGYAQKRKPFFGCFSHGIQVPAQRWRTAPHPRSASLFITPSKKSPKLSKTRKSG